MPCTLEIFLKLGAQGFRNTIKYIQLILLKNSIMSSWCVCGIIHKSKIQDVLPEPALDFGH